LYRIRNAISGQDNPAWRIGPAVFAARALRFAMKMLETPQALARAKSKAMDSPAAWPQGQTMDAGSMLAVATDQTTAQKKQQREKPK
jgi:hypothetical protein